MQCQGLWNDANLVEYYDIEKFKLVERNNIKTQITKKEKKKKEKKTDNSNISKQLKTLNNLYKSGALTKEEFEKAKKKLLN
jgi:multidrug resistance efflux pump